ncbi:YidB family protein [Dryocola clanedunensis]|uniref:YidB family protein n=1 Tax=Cedecea sulfonylureivorans TaxID=3051154 RepID=UPI001925BF22|nr:YidB family protein [Cedecea sulfonylureivorans]
MSLFDNVMGMVGKNLLKPENIKSVLAWLEQQGGISALVTKFSQAGLGDVLSSWLGKESNAAINEDQVQQVFGLEELKKLAAETGITPAMATTLLAQSLPQIVDLLTPDGETPHDNDLVSAGLNLLKGKLLG